MFGETGLLPVLACGDSAPPGLAGAQFIALAAGSVSLPPGRVFTAIDNTSATAITGTFSNLADGSRIAVGYRAMALASSYSSVAIGSQALVLDQGQLNVAVGTESLTANVNGTQNTALGWRSLFNNKNGS